MYLDISYSCIGKIFKNIIWPIINQQASYVYCVLHVTKNATLFSFITHNTVHVYAIYLILGFLGTRERREGRTA